MADRKEPQFPTHYFPIKDAGSMIDCFDPLLLIHSLWQGDKRGQGIEGGSWSSLKFPTWYP